MDRFLREAPFGRDSRYFIVEDASHAAFGLLTLEEFADALVLHLVGYICLGLSRGLKLPLTNYEDVIVCNAFMLKDLTTGCNFSF